MRYTAPRIVNIVNAKNAIQSVKGPSIPNDGDPFMKTAAAYESDE
jgi:hypothetical protein